MSETSDQDTALLRRTLADALSEAKLERALRRTEMLAHDRALEALQEELSRARTDLNDQRAELAAAARRAVGPADGHTSARAAAAAAEEGDALIVLVSHDLTRSGAPIALLHIARELVRQGRGKVLLFSKAGGPLEDDFAQVAPLALLGEQSTDPADLGALDAALAYHGVARRRVAFCNTILSFDVAEALKARGFAVVGLVHEMPAVVNHFGLSSLQRLAAASDVVVFGAHYVREKLAAAFGFSHPRAAVVRTAVGDTTPPDAVGRRANALALRRECAFPPESVVVLGCGSVDRRKGVDLLIEVAHRVRGAPEDIRFAWIGHGETDTYAQACHAQVAELGLGDRFRFLPPRVGVDAEISGADIFALPSREDPFPLVNVSALALGVPVIAFDGSGGAPEVVAPDAGLTVPFNDLGAFAAAVTRLAGAPEERARLGQGGIARYRRDLTIRSTVNQLTALTEAGFRTA